MAETPVVTLTTDFGLSDPFAAVMKGVILSINPEAQVIDLSHQVSSYDLFDGATTLALAYPYFPTDTIHVVVVDPGVGSARRPILVSTRRHKFVAPDNGVLSLVYEREKELEVRCITAEHYFLKPVSNTFHGRDIFAPVAAWLSKGVQADKFGEVITNEVRFAMPKSKSLEGRIQGVVIRVDKFGNLITNIGPAAAPALFGARPPAFRLTVSKAAAGIQQEITELHISYSEGKASELFAIAGSSGYLEIAQNRASAAKTCEAGRGAEVILTLG
ncbi:MAG: SAM hydrolase/SAM-dependent halogenase family protein [Terriglobia bacterium]